MGFIEEWQEKLGVKIVCSQVCYGVGRIGMLFVGLLYMRACYRLDGIDGYCLYGNNDLER